MKYHFRNDKTLYCEVRVLMVKFQKSFNFPSNKNIERLLLDLLNIKPGCSYQNYVAYHFFYKALNMQNGLPFEGVFVKGKDKSIAGLL